jgi:selenophosphate synthase
MYKAVVTCKTEKQFDRAYNQFVVNAINSLGVEKEFTPAGYGGNWGSFIKDIHEHCVIENDNETERQRLIDQLQEENAMLKAHIKSLESNLIQIRKLTANKKVK